MKGMQRRDVRGRFMKNLIEACLPKYYGKQLKDGPNMSPEKAGAFLPKSETQHMYFSPL